MLPQSSTQIIRVQTTALKSDNSKMMGFTELLHVLTVLQIACISFGNGAPAGAVIEKPSDPDNEVIKVPEVEFPNIPTKFLEAYYSQLFSKAGGSNLTFPEIKAREGLPVAGTSCEKVTSVPEELRSSAAIYPSGIDFFYQKYTHAYGIPVLASSDVSNRAIQRACYVLQFLLADREDLREAYYKANGRVVIIGKSEFLKDIPEYRFLPDVFNKATRGLSAIPEVPVSSASEENILCDDNDRDHGQDILIRQIAQGILHLYGMNAPDVIEQLEAYYEEAVSSGWWAHTYGSLSRQAYFGEAVQIYFGTNERIANNTIVTRTQLASYDASLFTFIRDIFPCGNEYHTRCQSRGYEHLFSLMKNYPKCDLFSPIRRKAMGMLRKLKLATRA